MDEDEIYVPFTRRTNEPKLRWLERQLRGRRIPHLRDGESFHAPILKVHREYLSSADKILSSVDDIADDDPRWLSELEQMCGCTVYSTMTMDTHPPKCSQCGKPRFLLVNGE